MIITARTGGADGLAARLAAALAPRLAQDAAAAAARRVVDAAAREGVALRVESAAAGLRVCTGDADAVARETGTLSAPAVPWLAPLLLRLRRRR